MITSSLAGAVAPLGFRCGRPLRRRNWDRYAIAQNQGDSNPSVGDIQSSPPLGEPNQASVGNAVELGEQPQVFCRLTRDPQGLLLRGVNRGLSHRLFLLLMSRPGSAELIETKLPWSSRVVSYRSLVRPEWLTQSHRKKRCPREA
jgi:hypothetical protein